MLDKTYSRHRLCYIKPTPCIGYVGQNLLLALVMLEKPIPGIGYVGQSIFPGVSHTEQNLIWDSVVQTCKTSCFPSKK